MNINKLASNTIQHISTSVTLQTLSSFVKELIENSIDAASTSIVVIFYESGKYGLQVQDNGVGIPFREWEKVAHKGATSKLESWDGLKDVQTHGFRGEALNAISQMSELAITTRHVDDELGWKYNYTLNEDVERVQRERGTTIKISNLFHSLPVRKIDFEKNFKQQYNKAINLLTEYAVIQEKVDFRVFNHDRQNNLIINSGLPSDLHTKIRNVLGDQYLVQLMPISFAISESESIQGYIQKTIDSGSISSKRSLFCTYLNARPINPPKSLTSLLNQIYRQYNNQGQIICILNFKIREADFNVSVDKRDVYFKNENKIMELFQNHLINQIEGIKEIGKPIESQKNNTKQRKNTIPQNVSQEDPPQPPKVIKTKNVKNVTTGFLSQLRNSMGNQQDKNKSQQINSQNRSEEIIKGESSIQQIEERQIQIDNQVDQQPEPLDNDVFKNVNSYTVQDENLIISNKSVPFKKEYFNDLEVIGQFNNGFIVTWWQKGNQVLVIDQHACDEKTNYENLQSKCKLIPTKLMKPFEVQFQPHEIEIMEQKLDLLAKNGIKATVDNMNDRLIVHTLPSYNKQTFGIDIVRKFLDSDEVHGLKQILAMQACRGSIMIGQVLNKDKMKEMCQKLATLKSPWNCPHGRPTFLRVDQIEYKTLRRGFSKNI